MPEKPSVEASKHTSGCGQIPLQHFAFAPGKGGGREGRYPITILFIQKGGLQATILYIY